PPEEFIGGLTQQRQVALHAAGDVEHRDQSNRLRRVVEDGNRLRLALVADLEVALLEVRDEMTILVHDGDEHADGFTRALEGRLLLLLRVRGDQRQGADADGRARNAHSYLAAGAAAARFTE